MNGQNTATQYQPRKTVDSMVEAFREHCQDEGTDYLEYVAVEVEPDLDLQSRIHAAWEEFWPLYASRTPPEPVEGDYIERFDPEWLELESRYLTAKAALKAAER